MVLAVGARSRVHASCLTDVTNKISMFFDKVEFCLPIIPIIFIPFFNYREDLNDLMYFAAVADYK